jgi:hypothetical protein
VPDPAAAEPEGELRREQWRAEVAGFEWCMNWCGGVDFPADWVCAPSAISRRKVNIFCGRFRLLWVLRPFGLSARSLKLPTGVTTGDAICLSLLFGLPPFRTSKRHHDFTPDRRRNGQHSHHSIFHSTPPLDAYYREVLHFAEEDGKKQGLRRKIG